MQKTLTIVTAADVKYWRSLYQLLLSAERTRLHRTHKFIAYDLGLGEKLADLTRRFPWVTFRRFAFENYPAHVALEARSYAWKPMIVGDVLAQSDGYVLWLDSATILKRRGLNHAGRDRVHAYPLRCQLDREVTDERLERRLRGADQHVVLKHPDRPE